MPPTDDEEPVGYLEGSSAEVQSEVGFSSSAENPYGSEDPYGVADDEEVVGYLEGSEAAGEDLPALPPMESATDFSARDFIDDDAVAEEPYEDPYATAEGYDDYADYDADAMMAESDPSYFDSMGHDGQDTQTIEEEYADDYDDGDQPKTISQQDAESIIRRITTKRIQPEPETRPAAAMQPTSFTPASRRTPIWPIVLVLLILGGAAVYLFRLSIGEKLHEMGYPDYAAMLGYEPPTEVTVDDKGPTETRQERRRRVMREMVLKSEAIAFGLSDEQVEALGDGASGEPAGEDVEEPGGEDGAGEGEGAAGDDSGRGE